MLGIGRTYRGTIARVAVFGLLFQAFFAALHLPGIQSADAATAIDGSIVICSGDSFRRISISGPEQNDQGRPHTPDTTNCAICLSLSCCALAMPMVWIAEIPASLRVLALLPAAQDVMHDHRQAIRPGHDPPASV